MKLSKKMVLPLLWILAIIIVCICIDSINNEKRIEGFTAALEKSTKLEAGFAKKQQLLMDSINKEQQLFVTISQSSIDQEREIQENTKQALKKIDQAKGYLKETKQSFHDAYIELESMESTVSKIKDSDQRKKAANVLTWMSKRNTVFHAYSDNFSEAMKAGKDIYRLLGEKKYNDKKLDEQVKVVNRLYKEMDKQREQFNQYTKKFTQAKNAFLG